jgi:hypothetical protein
MGDRANVFVREQRDDDVAGVYLYTHWGGYELAQTVQDALAKKWRWDDGQYLTRIIFDEMTKDNHGEETGFGISTGLCDNEHKIIVVDPDKGRIGFCGQGKEKTPGLELQWSFEEYVNLDSEELGQEYLER